MEIEKKFTIKFLPKDLEKYEKKVIEQGYLCTNPIVRIRKCNENYVLTYKSKIGIEDNVSSAKVCNEVELPLTEEGYYHLREKIDNHLIAKSRYIIPISNGLKAELDIFDGYLKGLIFVEVEFPDVSSADLFEPPKWFAEDVSFDIRYANHYLSKIDQWE